MEELSTDYVLGLSLFPKVKFEQIRSPSGREIYFLVADLFTEMADEEVSGSTSLAAHTVDSDPPFDRKGRRIRKRLSFKWILKWLPVTINTDSGWNRDYPRDHCLRAASASLPGRFFGRYIARDSMSLFSLTWEVHAISSQFYPHCTDASTNGSRCCINRDENHCWLSHLQTGPVVFIGTHDPQTEIKPLESVVVDRTNRNAPCSFNDVAADKKFSSVPIVFPWLFQLCGRIHFSSLIQTWIHFFWQNNNYLQYNL